MTYDWFDMNGYADEIVGPSDVRFVCEQDAIVLRPFQNYYFVVDWNCAKCVEIAKTYGYEPEGSNV